MRNYLTFDNKDSRDFGVYINGQGTFRAPARSYNVLNIPGRNGDLLGFGSKLENVEITYRAFIYTNFDANIAALRSFLLSHVGYFKLTDSYHPDEYRLAYYKGPFVPDVVANNGAGSFDLTFVCKPQRFLNSGEEVTTLTPAGAEQHTYQGEIVNFSTLAGDKITSARADFHPIQDLHGYDSPWPGVGGVNKINFSNCTAGGTAFGLTSAISGEYFRFTGTCSNGGTHAWVFGTINSEQRTVAETLNFNGFVISGGSGLVITAISYNSSNGALSVKLGGLVKNQIYDFMIGVVAYEGSTVPTSWTPYSNICPITGRTGAEVYRTGENLFDASLATLGARLATSGYIFNDADYYCTPYMAVEVGKTYFKNSPTVDVYHRWWTYDANKAPIRKVDDSNTITIESGEAFVRFCGLKTEINSAYCGINGTYATYPLSWQTEAGTVYGGTVDVVTGLLTVDMASVDLGTLNWQYESSGATRFFTDGLRSSIKFPTNYDTAANAISSMYANRTYNQFAATEKANGTMAVSSSGWLSVRNTAYADVASFTAAMNGQTFVYELATPLTYQLTPQEVEALADNYMWSDVGQVTVTVTDAMTIENPTLFDAKPLLRVYGAGTLTLGGQTITISTADVYTDIDCEMMDCFKDTVSKNGNVSFSGYDFPVIPPGRNVITMDGVTQVDITPRWWAA